MSSAVGTNLAMEIASPFPVDLEAQITFWDAPNTISWFEEKGYTLYKRTPGSTYCSVTIPSLPFPASGEHPYPFASYDTSGRNDEDPYERYGPLRTIVFSGKVVFAQDSEGRHVAIKLIAKGTDEHRIYRLVQGQSLETLKNSCILPVLDILPIDFGEFCFAVMPRWGNDIWLPRFQSIQELLPVFESLLRGLCFLHKNNIIYRDFKLANILINHFADDNASFINPVRAERRAKGQVLYAMFDFDLSLMVPPNVDKGQFRLRYHESWLGSTFPGPRDTMQGEFDYDPFTYDVGILGAFFCQRFQHQTAIVPGLAPLFDGMVTHEINKRFTADEALTFFYEITSELTDEQLNAPLAHNPPYFPSYADYDRWRHVPSDLAERWARYRIPPIPRTSRFLAWLCSRSVWLAHTIPHVRRFFFTLTTLPGTFLSLFSGHPKFLL